MLCKYILLIFIQFSLILCILCTFKITGVQKDIDEVVAAIKEEMRLYDADKEDRQLRSYEIQVFHYVLINK